MSVCRSLVDRRQRPNPDTGGKATAAAGDGQDRLKARCVTDAEGEGLPGLARALRRGKPDPAKASGTWRHPRPLSGRRKSRFWRIERPATSPPRRAPVSGSQREGSSPGSGVRISPRRYAGTPVRCEIMVLRDYGRRGVRKPAEQQRDSLVGRPKLAVGTLRPTKELPSGAQLWKAGGAQGAGRTSRSEIPVERVDEICQKCSMLP